MTLPETRAGNFIARQGQRGARLQHSSLLRNSSLLMATTIFTAGLGYLYWVIAARGYEAQSVGLATALIAGQAFTAMVCCLGIDALLIQVLPQAGDDRAWSTMVSVGVAVGVALSTVVATVVALVLPGISSHYAILDRPAALLLFVLGSALGTAGIITDSVFVASRRSENMLVRNLTFGLVKLPIMALPILVSDKPGVLTILTSWVLANGMSLLLAYGYQMRRLRPGYHPAFRSGLARLLRVRRNIGAHFLANVGSQAPQFLLPILVVAIVSPQANAYFYLTWSVGGIFLIISPATSTSLFAEGSNAEDLVANARRSVYLITALLLPMILGSLLLSRQILSVFGREYAREGTTLLRILALSAIPDAITNIYVSIERVKGHLGRAAALNVATAVVAVGLTIVLVRHDGVSGPGWAWLVAQGAGAAVVLYSVVRSIAGPSHDRGAFASTSPMSSFAGDSDSTPGASRAA